MIINNKTGFSLVELVVAIGIFFILASGVLFVITNSYTNFIGSGDRQTIANFAKEGLEATQAIANNNWSDIVNAVGSNHGVALNSSTNKWEFSGTSDTSGNLTRVITLANVERDGFNIKASGGVNDPLTKKVTVTVSGTGISDYVLATYITNWRFSTIEQTDWRLEGGYEFWMGDAAYDSADTIDATTTVYQITLTNFKGDYYTPGNLISSKINLFATDRKLWKVEVNQDVPSGCVNDITLEVSSDSTFGSPTTQVFDTTDSYYKEDINTNMSGYEWMRYQVDMQACNGDTETPTLYSFKIYYQ